MSQEKRRLELSREGVDTLSEVSAFLGGIFFTGLLILVQQRNQFELTLSEITLQGNLKIRITQIHMIAVPLSISVILFVFSSLFFAIACCESEETRFEKLTDVALNPFILGLLSVFISLFAVLSMVDISVSVFGMIISVATFVWWLRKRARL